MTKRMVLLVLWTTVAVGAGYRWAVAERCLPQLDRTIQWSV